MGLCTTACIKILRILADCGVEGKTLCMMGRQDIDVEWNSFMKMVDCFNLSYKQSIYQNLKGKYPIDTYEFFKMFGFNEVHAVDVRTEDGADIILNLCEDLSENMFEKYDYIIDGGTLEHVFDAAKAISNMSKMLKNEGIIIHAVPMTGYIDHGFYSFSPCFFIDYYNKNNFVIKDIVMDFRMDNCEPSEWNSVYSMDCRLFNGWHTPERKKNEYIKAVSSLPNVGNCLLWCVARKRKQAGQEYPIQSVYTKIESNKHNIVCLDKVIDWFKYNTTKRIGLFCAGKICNSVIDGLFLEDMEDYIQLIFDNDISKAGSRHRGLKIVYPTRKKLDMVDLILICSERYEMEIYKELIEQGIKTENIHKITEFYK